MQVFVFIGVVVAQDPPKYGHGIKGHKYSHEGDVLEAIRATIRVQGGTEITLWLNYDHAEVFKGIMDNNPRAHLYISDVQMKKNDMFQTITW